MGLNVKVVEMMAKIKSQRRIYVRRSFSSTMDDWLRDSYVYVKKMQEELKEENRRYKLI